MMLNQDPKDITSGPTTQMGWWYKENDKGLYLRPLRNAETTQDLRILSYTSNFTNADHTMALINAALAKRTRMQVFHQRETLSYQIIPDHGKGKIRT